MTETLEDILETARQAGTPVALAFAGRFDHPITAKVVARNGSTFEFLIDGRRVRMDVANVVIVG
jgi:hypothetical protein